MKYLKQVAKKNGKTVCFYLGLGIFLAFLQNLSAGYLQTLIDALGAGRFTLAALIFYAGILVLLCVLSYAEEYPFQKLQKTIYLELKVEALRKISRIDYQSYLSLGTGRLVQQIENGAQAGKSILFDFYFSLISELAPSLVFSLFFIFRTSRGVTIAILAGYVVVFIVSNLLLKALYRLKEKILVNEELLNHFLVRGFMELVTFRINRRFSTEIDKAEKSKREIVSAQAKMKMIHEAFFAIFALMVIAVKIAVIAFGWQTGGLTVGAVVALLTLVDNAYIPIAIFNVKYVQYKLDKTAYRRFTDFLDAPDDGRLQSGKPAPRLSGELSIDGLAFGYEGRQVFRGLSLQIQAGEGVALVGESGSGKSTLVKLLTGLLKPTAGTIAVDGIPLDSLNLDSYYTQVAYVPQEAPIFDGTLRENLVFDREIPDSDILEALEQAGLGPLYRKLPQGLETELGEKGTALSGGERQRLALARLWFSEEPIVILDEATSALDNLTEDAVMRNVMKRLEGRTVIIIAHRLRSIRDIPRVVAFRFGEVAGDGSFERLSRENEYFRELVKSGETSRT